jgi:phage virion morphogenesis protein
MQQTVSLQNFPALMAAVNRAIAWGHDPLPTMQNVGRYMEESTKLRFQAGVGPDGVPWAPSKRVQAEGGKTLILSTNLMQSVTNEATRTEAVVGTNMVYANIQQTGGTIEPRTAKALAFQLPGIGLVFAHHVTLPARPFIGLNDNDQAHIGDIIIDDFGLAVGA